jgi:hypothetical protein
MCCWTVLRIRRHGLHANAVAGDSAFADSVSHVGVATRARHADVVGDATLIGDGTAIRRGAATWLIWLALAGSALMAACAFLTPFWQQPGFPLEYQLLLAWGLLGYLVWRFALTQQSDPSSPNTREPW